MIALQLYTVRSKTETDMLGTLRELAGMGFTAVEFAGLKGYSAREIKATLDEVGMIAMGAHIPYERFQHQLDGVLEEMTTLGAQHAVVPWLQPDQRGSERFAEHVANFNAWAARCQAEGLTFSYHNHDFEFTSTAADGTTLFDWLLRETDPTLVNIELDIYWAAYTDRDPVAVVKQLAGRMPLLHAKDYSGKPDKSDAPFGEGVIDWAKVRPAAEAAGVEWWVVEQDVPANPMADAARSLANLTRFLG
jgi:sugar phosphate isomerase/epimerase